MHFRCRQMPQMSHDRFPMIDQNHLDVNLSHERFLYMKPMNSACKKGSTGGGGASKIGRRKHNIHSSALSRGVEEAASHGPTAVGTPEALPCLILQRRAMLCGGALRRAGGVTSGREVTGGGWRGGVPGRRSQERRETILFEFPSRRAYDRHTIDPLDQQGCVALCVRDARLC